MSPLLFRNAETLWSDNRFSVITSLVLLFCYYINHKRNVSGPTSCKKNLLPMSCNTRFLRALAAESYPSSYKVHRLNASLSDRNAVGSSRTKPSMSRMASFIRHVYNAQRPILLTHSVNSACRGSGAAIVGPIQSSARYFGQSVSCFRSWCVALLKHSNACSQLPLAKYRSPWLTSKRGETVCTMGIFSNSEFMVAEA